MLVKLDFDKTIILSQRHQPKSFKAIKCWNIQKENEFRKDSAWVIQWTVWRQNQIVGHQIRTDDQANKKEESLFFQETQEEFPTQFSTIQNQRKGCLHNFDSDSTMYGQDGHFVAITDIHFHQNWLSGAHIQFFLILERSPLGVRVIKNSQTVHLHDPVYIFVLLDQLISEVR